jgi:hypothetical protein
MEPFADEGSVTELHDESVFVERSAQPENTDPGDISLVFESNDSTTYHP